jgi:hypothetical protein
MNNNAYAKNRLAGGFSNELIPPPSNMSKHFNNTNNNNNNNVFSTGAFNSNNNVNINNGMNAQASSNSSSNGESASSNGVESVSVNNLPSVQERIEQFQQISRQAKQQQQINTSSSSSSHNNNSASINTTPVHSLNKAHIFFNNKVNLVANTTVNGEPDAQSQQNFDSKESPKVVRILGNSGMPSPTLINVENSGTNVINAGLVNARKQQPQMGSRQFIVSNSNNNVSNFVNQSSSPQMGLKALNNKYVVNNGSNNNLTSIENKGKKLFLKSFIFLLVDSQFQSYISYLNENESESILVFE